MGKYASWCSGGSWLWMGGFRHPFDYAKGAFDRGGVSRDAIDAMSGHGIRIGDPVGSSTAYPARAHEVADVSGAGGTAVAVLTAGTAGGPVCETAMQLVNPAHHGGGQGGTCRCGPGCGWLIRAPQAAVRVVEGGDESSTETEASQAR